MVEQVDSVGRVLSWGENSVGMLINLELGQNGVLGQEQLVLWDEEVGSSGSSVPTHPLAASAPVQCCVSVFVFVFEKGRRQWNAGHVRCCQLFP